MSLRPSEPEAKKQECNPVKRYYKNLTRKNAIHTMCSYCHGTTATEQGNGLEKHLEPGFRKEIRHCSAPDCPLHRFRPFQQKNKKRVDGLESDEVSKSNSSLRKVG